MVSFLFCKSLSLILVPILSLAVSAFHPNHQLCPTLPYVLTPKNPPRWYVKRTTCLCNFLLLLGDEVNGLSAVVQTPKDESKASIKAQSVSFTHIEVKLSSFDDISSGSKSASMKSTSLFKPVTPYISYLRVNIICSKTRYFDHILLRLQTGCVLRWR